MKHTKRTLVGICTQLVLAFTLVFVPVGTVSAACSGSGSQGQVLGGIGETGGDCNGSGFTNVLSTIVSIISYIAGIVAIVMVIVAGVKYMTSAGDSNKASSAKSTLIYALIGLAIAVLAQVIVQFVINTASGAPGVPQPPPKS
ncbi:MAG TPA: pilin [Candidatus Saccharimonadales bacterium]|nr:pilin [Candidatus Saccharimonadales bacterium]